ENRVDWFVLQEGRYVAVSPDERSIIRSQVFPGLWLSVNGLRQGNRSEILAVLQEGLQTEEHQAFIEQLSR
ncbi:MAG TPA: hypothetical protein DCL61_06785, partial [Cyanobacteria bacterium UBA12227]|nr:hypothetical protein [Cyanobacteria bacterium UBA12227]